MFKYFARTHHYIAINGKLLNFAIARASVDGRGPLKNGPFLKAVFGKLFAGKGYIPEKLANILFVNAIHLIANIWNNMENSLMGMNGKAMLRTNVRSPKPSTTGPGTAARQDIPGTGTSQTLSPIP